ncbi:hypothetical protein PUN4_230109 [Paraburkholderia unamae]|nr:hypothetical protein PUN4_230109 [Paraburkholderia unamae]
MITTQQSIVCESDCSLKESDVLFQLTAMI